MALNRDWETRVGLGESDLVANIGPVVFCTLVPGVRGTKIHTNLWAETVQEKDTEVWCDIWMYHTHSTRFRELENWAWRRSSLVVLHVPQDTSGPLGYVHHEYTGKGTNNDTNDPVAMWTVNVYRIDTTGLYNGTIGLPWFWTPWTVFPRYACPCNSMYEVHPGAASIV